MLTNFIKRAIRAGFSSIGLDVRRIKTSTEPQALVPDIPHSTLRPQATYAPWLADHAFNAAYQMVREHTLVDLYRCYELWTLAGRLAQLRGDVIEIGVWRGGTGALIAKQIQTVAPDRTVYLCDTFSGVVGVGPRDTRYKGGEHADTSIETVRELIARMGLTNTQLLAGIFPEQTAKQISAERFALVHIDVDVHDSAKKCFEWAWPRMVIGGVVVFDDYGFHGCEGVTRMVNDIDEPNAIVIYNLNGHAIVVKLAGARSGRLSQPDQNT
jgi:O-methyltransferase